MCTQASYESGDAEAVRCRLHPLTTRQQSCSRTYPNEADPVSVRSENVALISLNSSLGNHVNGDIRVQVVPDYLDRSN